MKININHGQVEMSHGSGGRASAQLIEQVFMSAFNNEWLAQKNDFASLPFTSKRLVMATDSHVISPLFFPGGNIGSLSVHGTINDIAMSGATPLFLSASFILEEGFPLADLQRIVKSMGEAARDAGVFIVAGDTKVVERGKGDGVFITTSGVGTIADGIHISSECARVGDQIIISGYTGNHGVAVMAHRENVSFKTSIESDTAALHGLVACILNASKDIHCLRDPTRGGVATALNELAAQSQVGMVIDESSLPIKEQVAAACELLGLDPLYVANEGILLAICPSKDAQTILSAMHSHPLGKHAAIIGEVITDPRHFVQLKTHFGGVRIMDCLVGEQLPRIC